MGGGEWRGTPQTMGSQAWWGWVQISLFSGAGGGTGILESRLPRCALSIWREAWGLSTLGRMQGRPKGAPEPLFSWNPHGPLPNHKLHAQPVPSQCPPPTTRVRSWPGKLFQTQGGGQELVSGSLSPGTLLSQSSFHMSAHLPSFCSIDHPSFITRHPSPIHSSVLLSFHVL